MSYVANFPVRVSWLWLVFQQRNLNVTWTKLWRHQLWGWGHSSPSRPHSRGNRLGVWCRTTRARRTWYTKVRKTFLPSSKNTQDVTSHTICLRECQRFDEAWQRESFEEDIAFTGRVWIQCMPHKNWFIFFFATKKRTHLLCWYSFGFVVQWKIESRQAFAPATRGWAEKEVPNTWEWHHKCSDHGQLWQGQ